MVFPHREEKFRGRIKDFLFSISIVTAYFKPLLMVLQEWRKKENPVSFSKPFLLYVFPKGQISDIFNLNFYICSALTFDFFYTL